MYRKLILIIYILIVTGLSLIPSDSLLIPKVGLFPHADKVAHFLMYAGFSFLLFFTWPANFTGRARQFLPLLYIITWGLLMETFQSAGNLGRHFDYIDIIANTLGFFPGWLTWIVLSKNFNLTGSFEGENKIED